MNGDRDRRPSFGRSGLGVTTLKAGSDGVAYVGRLLDRALAQITGAPPSIVVLDPARTGQVTRLEKLRFATRLAQRGLAGSVDWWLFNHVGIARAHNRIPRRARRPYGVFLHGIEVWNPALDDDRIRCLLDAQTLIANSYHTASRVNKTHPALKQVTTCHLALLPETETGRVDSTIVDAVGPHSVLIVGRMSADERYKGHDQLLECWPSIQRLVPDAQLVIVGHGDDATRLREKADKTSVGDRILFTGFVDAPTLRAIRAKAALFAMPSRNEGFGLVYLEAMRAGLPCIGSTLDAAGEIIVEDETGYLVDPANREQIASTIVTLLRNEPMRQQMGEMGKKRFDAMFQFDHFVDRLRPTLESAFVSGD